MVSGAAADRRPAQLQMEQLEEILKVIGGLVFAAIYLFGNQIFKSRESNEAPPPNVADRGDDSRPASDAAARQRQIRESIRRKIMERRPATTTPSDQAPVRMPQTQRTEAPQQPSPVTLPVEPTRELLPNHAACSSDAYATQIQVSLQEIEATKRRAEQLRRQAGRVTPATEAHVQSPTHRGLRFGSVRSTLHNPDTARRAFVYSEVLGKPISLRPTGVGVTD